MLRAEFFVRFSLEVFYCIFEDFQTFAFLGDGEVLSYEFFFEERPVVVVCE